MRYAVLSDIHGNLEAFRAVLDSISKEKIDAYLSIGDVIGYGADPIVCMRLLRSVAPQVLIAGNHEWAVLGLADIEYFNEAAKAAVLWTKEALRGEGLDYIKSFTLVHEDKGFSLVHGSLDHPEKFYYILDYDDACDTMRLMKTKICFVGHSHAAGIFYSKAEEAVFTKGPRIRIDRARKYIINAGSIGQPRDLDPRAAYVIYDEEEGTVEIKRVEYDVKSAQDKILKAGLPEILAWRLAEGR